MRPISTYPTQVFLDLTLTCNLRCVHCDIHKMNNPEDELSLPEKKQVVDQVADWGGQSMLILAGGEPFTRRSQMYELAAACKERNVPLVSTSNGTLVNDQDVELLPRSGITYQAFSIDSHLPALHDQMRGVPGTFARVIQSISRLAKARDDCGEDFHVTTNTILGSHNLDALSAIIDLLTGLGVDHMSFQPIQPNFCYEYADEWWKHDRLFPAFQQAERGIDLLIEKKRAGARLYQSEEQFNVIREYFLGRGKMTKGGCRSMEHNLMVDAVGDVKFCFFQQRLGLPAVSNVRRERLADIWAKYQDVRENMRGCSKGCRALLCHNS